LLPVLLLLAGGAIAFAGIWQFRRWIQETQDEMSAGPRRLEVIVDELVATAETTVAAIEEKTEALAGSLSRADLAVKRVEEAIKAAQELAAAPKPPSGKAAREDPAPKASAAKRGGTKPPPRAPVAQRPLQPAIAPSPEILTAEQERPAPRPELKLAEPLPSREQEIRELLGRRPPPRMHAPERPVAARPAEPAPRRPESGAAPADLPDLHQRVYALTDKGVDVTDIARQLSMTKGEVQLILGLRRMN